MYQFENGVHDIPNDIYHASKGVSRSALMEFKRSPLHYWFKYVNPYAIPEKATPAMKLGEYVHALVLEPQYFEERYAVAPMLSEVPKMGGLLKELGREEFDRQKALIESIKVANEMMMDEFTTASWGKEIVSLEAYKEAKAIADSVLRNDIAKALFTDVKIEQSIYFTHKETGLQCKVRPDAWAGSVVTDLKTCADASERGFQIAAYRGGYFIQAGMIKQALESIGIRLKKFVFYCVEKSPALPCVHYPLDEESLLIGETQFNNLMYGLADCIDNDDWPSYEPKELKFPEWARYEDL